ncbi:MAG: hypothetical protein ACOYJ2_08770 [Rickettsiales bacterium]
MESLDYWRLCDELSVIQAALLIVGYDPSNAETFTNNNPFSVMIEKPAGFEAAKAALTNAVMSGDLAATIRRDALKGHVEESNTEKWLGQSGKHVLQLDISLTTIKVKDLRAWLSSRGFTTGFFFPKHDNKRPNYLDTQHPNYSPKLAAAIEAWVAITEAPEKTKGKTVKKSLEIWLRANAGRFGLIKDDGNPNTSGIEEITKVANWGTKGGAPKTP